MAWQAHSVRVRVAVGVVATLGCATWAHANHAGDVALGGDTPAPGGVLTAWSVASALMLAGLLGKRTQAWALASVPTYGQPILVTMFQELTLLGGLSLLLFAIEYGGLTRSWSISLFGEDNPDTLPQMVRAIDMLLVLVVFAFLISVVALVFATRRIDKRWHRLETEARLAAALLVAYFRASVDQAAARSRRRCWRPAACVRWLLCCLPRSRKADLEEQVVYASMRARFVRPPVTFGLRGHSKRGTALSALLNSAKEKHVDLRDSDARLYQPKNTVFAFEARGPVKFFSEGEITEGQAGDWVIVGHDGDVTVVSADEFQRTFAAVPNQSGQYRRVEEVLAELMQEPYLANTKHGYRRGKPGTFLIQELEPEPGKTECYQWWLSPHQFRQAYEPVDPRPDELIENDRLESLPIDFDFAM